MSNTITPKAIVEPYGDNPKHFKVSADWSALKVDRPISFSSVVTSKKLAERFARAIEAGAAFPFEGIRTDVNGRTYVESKFNVMARRANADLTRLGY